MISNSYCKITECVAISCHAHVFNRILSIFTREIAFYMRDLKNISLKDIRNRLPELPFLKQRWFLVTVAALIVVLLVGFIRSEEHTSELQSRENIVCRLLLEKINSFHS